MIAFWHEIAENTKKEKYGRNNGNECSELSNGNNPHLESQSSNVNKFYVGYKNWWIESHWCMQKVLEGNSEMLQRMKWNEAHLVLGILEIDSNLNISFKNS